MGRKAFNPVFLWQLLLTVAFISLLLQACGNLTAVPEATPSPQFSAPSTANLLPDTSTLLPISLTPVPTGANWQMRWLQKIPCAAPCWEGITPGITTAKEALDILTKNKNIVQAQINWSGGQSEVGWEWFGGTHTKGNYADGGGRAFFDSNDGKPIYLIVPTLENPIFFGDIIKVYGEPSHVLAGFNRNIHGETTYFYYLVYLPLGFALFHSEIHKFDISDNIFYFNTIYFFGKNFEGFKKASTSENEYKYIVPWQGLKTFDFYCQTREKNDFEPCSNV